MLNIIDDNSALQRFLLLNNETSEDGRLKRIEKLVLNLMVMNEDQEREIGYLRQEVSGGKAKEGAGDRRAGGL